MGGFEDLWNESKHDIPHVSCNTEMEFDTISLNFWTIFYRNQVDGTKLIGSIIKWTT